MKPKVSIITPTFNAERFIRSTAESVLSQTFQDWEWIIVDDASKDRTIDILRSLGDNRIKIYILPSTNNPAISRNIGVNYSKGDYIALLDHDDLYDTEKLRLQVQFLQSNKDTLAVHTDAKVLIDESGIITCRQMRRDLSIPPKMPPNTLIRNLLNGNFVYFSSFMCHRELFNNLSGFGENPSIVTTHDFDFFLKMAEQGYGMGYIDKSLTTSRRSENSMVSNTAANMENSLANIRLAISRKPIYYAKFKKETAYFIRKQRFRKGVFLLRQSNPQWRKEVLPYVFSSSLKRMIKWLPLIIVPTRVAKSIVGSAK